jgi:hypothetical protein
MSIIAQKIRIAGKVYDFDIEGSPDEGGFTVRVKQYPGIVSKAYHEKDAIDHVIRAVVDKVSENQQSKP